MVDRLKEQEYIAIRSFVDTIEEKKLGSFEAKVLEAYNSPSYLSELTILGIPSEKDSLDCLLREIQVKKEKSYVPSLREIVYEMFISIPTKTVEIGKDIYEGFKNFGTMLVITSILPYIVPIVYVNIKNVSKEDAENSKVEPTYYIGLTLGIISWAAQAFIYTKIAVNYPSILTIPATTNIISYFYEKTKKIKRELIRNHQQKLGNILNQGTQLLELPKATNSNEE